MLNEKLEKLNKLVDRFKTHYSQYKSNYDESNTRTDFIDPFFELLDWDIKNEQGFSEDYRDVVREDKIKIQGKPKAPDYSFRIGGKRIFFVEAKKPSVDIKQDIDPAYQVRRYGYTAKVSLSILTDFEEFAVYDTRIKPDHNDKASVARIFYCTYEEYEKNFEFIHSIFSKTAILKGSFDKYSKENERKKGTSEVDKEFLKLIDNWREELAKNIAIRNKDVDIKDLNYSVQKTIDRLIFFRIAEDRGTEKYGILNEIIKNKDIYSALNKVYKDAKNKYNGELFEYDQFLEALIIDDSVLKSIISQMYYPECPYEFSVMPIETLGNIYEQFLGKTIRLTPSHQAKIEEKPEIRKAGGVYYTPQYIVDYIVENTVGEKIKDKTPEEIELIKILDPACGSGSFLIGAYTYLLRYHLNYYTKSKTKTDDALKKGKIYQIDEKHYHLAIVEKQKILLNNIFGVDIDSQAVEVTKLSLLLKLTENETKESEGYLFRASDVKLLPNLNHNIKCGNSLIGSDFYKDKDLSLFGKDEMQKVNVFDWDKEFPEVFKAGGFDCVIGNPPYVAVDFTDNEKKYFKKNYITAQYQLDLYILFLEKAVNSLKNNAYISYITPNSWLKNLMMSNCRLFLLDNLQFIKIVPKLSNVFLSASVDTLIFVALKDKNKNNANISIEELNNSQFVIRQQIEQKSFRNNDKYIFTVEINKNIEQIISKMKNETENLDKYFEITRGVNPYDVYTGQKRDIIDNKAYHSDYKKDKTFVPELRGKHIKRYFYKWDEKHYISYGEWLAAPRDPKFFKGERIIFREILGKNFECTLISEDIILDRSLYIALPKKELIKQIQIKYVLALLCSRLLAFYFRYISNEFDDLFPKIRLAEFKLLPIKITDIQNQNIFSNKVDQMLDTQKQFHEEKSESDKKIFKQKIDLIDKQIDSLVYELYGLTEEEIKIVEGN